MIAQLAIFLQISLAFSQTISDFCTNEQDPSFLTLLSTPFFQVNNGSAERYVAYQQTGLAGIITGATGYRVADITVPLDPQIASAFSPLSGITFDAAILNDDRTAVIVGVDQGDPNSDFVIADTGVINATVISTTPMARPFRVAVTENDEFAYVIQENDSSLCVFDIRNLSAPITLPCINTSAQLPGFFLTSILVTSDSGTELLYVGFSDSSSMGAVAIFSLSSPGVPAMISQTLVDFPVTIITSLPNNLMALGGANSLWVLDVSNSLSPLRLSLLTTDAPVNSIRRVPNIPNNLLVSDLNTLEYYQVNTGNGQLSLIRDLTIPFNIRDFVVFANSGTNFFYFAAGTAGTAIYCAGNFLDPQPSEDDQIPLIVGLTVGLGCGCFLLICLVSSFAFYVWRKKGKSRDDILVLASIPNTRNNVDYLKDITVGNVLGKGQFGKVYKGEWNNAEVALKALNSEDVNEFENELLTLRSLDHPHVIHCYGLYLHQSEPHIVIEFMHNGDLLTYLQKNQDVELLLLQQWAVQCATGIAYLHSKNIIHRDLAARNLLLAKDLTIKIGDFGLSRATENYYQSSSKMIPIRWAAPEAIKFQKFSPATDVWSYGVVLFEIFTRGGVPYTGMSNMEVAEYVQAKGHKLTLPPETPEVFQTVFERCFCVNPAERPTFKEILKKDLKKLRLTLAHEPQFDVPPPSSYQSSAASASHNTRNNNYNLEESFDIKE